MTSGIDLNLTSPDPASFGLQIDQLVSDRVASRLAAQDSTLWGAAAEAESSIRLAWVGLAKESRPLVAQIEALRAELSAEGLDRVVLAGMGGSSLAPEVICATAGVDLLTLDTTDAGQVRAALARDLDRTVVVVSSKSGGTVETDSHRRAFEAAFTAAGIDPKRRIIVVTDPGSPLQKASDEAGYRRVFLANPNVGGRYSALTAFGLVPSGLAGADIGALLDDAEAVSAALGTDSADNPGLRLGALMGVAHNSGSDKMVFADAGSGIVGFGDWAEQLIAESTGKDAKGILPVVVEGQQAPGYADARTDATLVTLGGKLPSAAAPSGFAVAVAAPLGAQMLLWEHATAVCGRIIGINPFDQPNVEEAKQQSRQLLDAPAGGSVVAPDGTDGVVAFTAANFAPGSATSLPEVLTAFFDSAPDLGYVSVQAYLDRHADSAAADLRELVAERTDLQTTFGWGPRFLHSTGQYHKGGHPNGVFLQITADVAEDLAVPDRPYTFGVLQAAQAAGDAAVLVAKGRPVLRLHVSDRAAGIAQIAKAIATLA